MKKCFLFQWTTLVFILLALPMTGCFKEDPSIAFTRGLVSFNNRQYTQAMREMTDFMKNYPDDERVPLAWMFTGDALRHQGLIDPATAQYSQIIDKYPGTEAAAESQFRLALASLQVGRDDLAIEQIRQAQTFADEIADPTRVTQLKLRFKEQECRMHLQAGNWEQALQGYREFAELDPEPAGKIWALSRQAYCLGLAGDTVASLELYHEFFDQLEENPSEKNTLTSITASVMQEVFGLVVSATEHELGHAFFRDRIEAVTPEHTFTRYGLYYDAALHTIAGNTPEAIAISQTIYDRYPDTELGMWSLVELADLHNATPELQHHYFEQALQAYSQIAQATDAHWRRRLWAYDMQSEVYRFKEDYEQAHQLQTEIARRFYYDREAVARANQKAQMLAAIIEGATDSINAVTSTDNL